MGLFSESLDCLTDFADLIGLNLEGAYLNLDAGFDSNDNKNIIRQAKMIPNIKVNPRGTKNRKKLYKRYDYFNEKIYEQRFTIERTFAWQDTYRKLVTRYEILECTHNGFKYLAYSLINLRWVVKENLI
jgi:hypothetical protein